MRCHGSEVNDYWLVAPWHQPQPQAARGNWLLAWMGYQVLSGTRKAPEVARVAGGSGEDE